MGKRGATGIAVECGVGEGVPSEDFSSPTADAVRSEEFPSSKGITSLGNKVSRAPEESEKEEAMSVPRVGICSRRRATEDACAEGSSSELY